MNYFNTLVNQILTESPMFFDKELSVDLNDKETNEKHLAACLRNGKKIKNFENLEVFQIKKESFIYFCFIRDENIEAYAEFFIDDQHANSKRVLQRKSHVSKGLLRRAFLNYFSNIFSSVKLDKIANAFGKQFFKKLMEEANKKGFKTVIVNENTNEEAPYDIKDFEQYWSGQSFINNKLIRPNNISFVIYYK